MLCSGLLLPLTQAQIANDHPHDTGIESDPRVLFVETFDDGLANIFSRYDDRKNTAGMSLDPDVPPGSLGPYSLKMTNLGGANTGGHLYKRFNPGWDSTVYIRYYVKYPAAAQGYIHHESIWIGGYHPATPWPNPQAGTCGLGDSRISVAYEPVGQTTMNTYLYWGGMHHDPNGNCWGNVLIKGSLNPAAVPFDQWLCVEIMIKLNNPASASNGELRIWHDGQDVGYWGPGFPNGTWVWDKFVVNPADPPFPGFRWRNDPDLDLNYLWIEYYDDQSPAGVSHSIQYDHLVVATAPIGPIFVPAGSNAPAAAAEFAIYPNPADERLTVQFSPAAVPCVVSLFDLLGQVVLTRQVDGPRAEFDVSALKPGAYWLQARGRDGAGWKRVIKF